MIAGACFLLLVSLAIEALLKGFSNYIQAALPGGLTIAVSFYLIFDFAVVVALFGMIFKILQDVRTGWRVVWVGAIITALYFVIGKFSLCFDLRSGPTASASG